MEYTILLYYKYVNIENPELLMDEQRALCEKLGLKGRILIAKEGINGTLEGLTENTEKYIEEMKKDERFQNIHWKKSQGIGNAFPKLAVKVKPEIVGGKLNESDVNPNEITGVHLKPEELRKWYEEKKDFVIVDMRNDYEYNVGRFKDSIKPEMRNFRELGKFAETLEPLKEKTVLTVCTGGVRCEKASGYLKKKGFKDVYQLDGGIVSYMEKYPSQDFEGSLYVFDQRKIMHFDKPENHKIVSFCRICNKPSENLVNCGAIKCKDQFALCIECGGSEDRKIVCKNCEEEGKKVIMSA